MVSQIHERFFHSFSATHFLPHTKQMRHSIQSFQTFFIVFIFLWQLYKLIQEKKKERLFQYSLIFLWFFLGILLFGFYKKPIYDYYFGFMFPASFLLVGNSIEWIVRSRWKVIGVIVGF